MKLNSQLRVLGIAAILMASAAAHAAPTCTTVGSSGSVGFTMAVASNFYAPAISLATPYANSQGYKIQICQDSSGNLYNSIVPSNSPQYAIFMSADTTRPANLSSSYPTLVAAGPTNYAKGIPAFVLSPNAYSATSGTYRAVNYLTTGLAAGAGANGVRSTSSLPAVSNRVKLKRSPSTPAVSTLAIGDTGLAPYGLAAAWIMGSTIGGANPPTAAFSDNMNQWNTSNVYSATTNVSATCSSMVSGSQWICSYSNIDYTLQAITNNKVTAGFVSYAQVCPTWAGSTYQVDQYVLFPDYYTTQSLVQLNVTDSTAQSRAGAFLSYLAIGTSTWNTWLSSNCYKSL